MQHEGASCSAAQCQLCNRISSKRTLRLPCRRCLGKVALRCGDQLLSVFISGAGLAGSVPLLFIHWCIVLISAADVHKLRFAFHVGTSAMLNS